MHSHFQPELIQGLGAICGLPAETVAIAASLFVAGLAGGFTHCGGMCGPFVLSQVSTRLGRVATADFGFLSRLGGAALVPYHLGRLTTYAGLGAAAGGLTGAFVEATRFRAVLSGFLLLAAALLILQLVGPLVPASQDGGASRARRFAAAMSGLAAPLFADPRGWRGYGLGVALGFLPCGLLYSALAAAAGLGSAAYGGLAMAAFVVGTFPALFIVGYGGVVFGRRWRNAVLRLAPALTAVNIVLLIAIAVRTLME